MSSTTPLISQGVIDANLERIRKRKKERLDKLEAMRKEMDALAKDAYMKEFYKQLKGEESNTIDIDHEVVTDEIPKLLP